MARTSLTAAESSAVELDQAALSADSKALTVMAENSRQIADAYGDGLAYERDRVVAEAKFFIATSAEAMLQLGNRLIEIKENEPYGEFTNIVTEKLGIPKRTAFRMMAASVKFNSPQLASGQENFLRLGKTKLFDLMEQSNDDELLELSEGGTVAGLKLDDMQTMTSRELKAALVEERKKSAAKDALIAKKDGKINELDEQLSLRAASPEAVDAAHLKQLQEDLAAADAAIARLVQTAGALMDQHTEGSVTLAARQSIDWAGQRFVEYAAEVGIAIDALGEAVEPAFLASAKPTPQG